MKISPKQSIDLEIKLNKSIYSNRVTIFKNNSSIQIISLTTQHTTHSCMYVEF